MSATVYTPDNELKEVIDHMWFDETDHMQETMFTLPFMHQELIINFGGRFSVQTGGSYFSYTQKGGISGLCQQQLTTRVAGKYKALGIMFKPQGLHSLFGINAATLTLPKTLETVWGKKLHNITQEIDEAATPKQKLSIVEKLLLSTAQPKKTDSTVLEFAALTEHEPLQKGRQKKYLQSRHFSQSSFIKQFRATFGLTPQKFLHLKQVNAAIAQIATSPKTPLTDVAIDCGFYDQAHFIRIFKKYTAITPLAYKKKVLAGKVQASFPNTILA